MRKLAALALISAILSTGCGSGANEKTPTGGLTGNWQMTLQSSTSSQTQPSEVQSGFLVQAVGNVSGSLLFSGQQVSGQTNCASVGSVGGQLSGTAISMAVDLPGLALNLTGTVGNNFTSMGGNYSILAAGCGQTETGTWSANQVSQLTGSFQATFTPYSSSVFHFTGTITQGPNTGATIATLSGTMTSSDSPCFTNVSIAGVVTGTAVTLNLLTSNGVVLGKYSGTMTTDATSVSGTFAFSNASDPGALGACAPFSGTAAMAVQPSAATPTS